MEAEREEERLWVLRGVGRGMRAEAMLEEGMEGEGEVGGAGKGAGEGGRKAEETGGVGEGGVRVEGGGGEVGGARITLGCSLSECRTQRADACFGVRRCTKVGGCRGVACVKLQFCRASVWLVLQ